MKTKNAALEHENVAVLLEHIPIGATRSIHSLPVKRVEADHYSIDNGPVVDLVDAMSQIGSYSGQHQNPDPAYIQANPDAFEENEVVQVHSKDFPGWTFRGVVSAVQDDGRYFVSTKHGEDLGAYDADELTHTMLPAQSHREAYATFPQETLRKHEAKIAAAQRRELARGRGRAGKAVRLVSFENPDPAYIQANPFVPAVREGLLERMEADGADTFAKKVKWVSKHMPNIDDANSFVAVLVRGEPKKGKKNPEEILNLKAKNPSRAHYYQVKNKSGQVVAYTTTKAEAESVRPAGGKVERL